MIETFTKNNPEASVEIDDGRLEVKAPWHDETIALVCEGDLERFAGNLNSVRLNPRFTGLQHLASGDLEFIFGPVHEDSPLRGRQFSFQFRGNAYDCGFADGSEELIAIAKHMRPAGPPAESDYRHLTSIRSHMRRQELMKESGRDLPFHLTSFWIRAVTLGEDEQIDLVRSLNFYMSYFDRTSPLVIVHADFGDSGELKQLPLPRQDAFPGQIVGRELDDFMLGFWESAHMAKEPIRAFLHSYQILEYASFYYLREGTLSEVKRLLLAPDIAGRLNDVTRQAIEVLTQEKLSDEQKIVEVCQRVVRPEALWAVIEPRKEFFSEKIIFDGGFEVSALVKSNWELDDFKTAWIPKLPDSLRKIRNCLVHAREQRMSQCIAPTHRNREQLRPWVEIIKCVAQDLILFDDI